MDDNSVREFLILNVEYSSFKISNHSCANLQKLIELCSGNHTRMYVQANAFHSALNRECIAVLLWLKPVPVSTIASYHAHARKI